MARIILIGMLLAITDSSLAENFSGVWQDIEGQLYSIHHKNEVVLMARLNTTKHQNSPYEQGNLFVTHEPLDLAINGSGFFTLINTDGSYTYTRKGEFAINSNGYIVDQENRKLFTLYARPLPVDLRQIKITEEGVITVNVEDSDEFIFHDQLILAWIAHTAMRFSGYPISNIDLSKVSLFKPDEPAENHFGASIMQGTIEWIDYEEKTWRAYQGAIENNTAIFNQVDDEGFSQIFNLIFDTDNQATVVYTNDFLLRMTASTQDIMSSNNDEIEKLTIYPKERINGPLTKIF